MYKRQVLGKFAGTAALGAVGSTTTLVTMFTDFLSGLSGGINVLAARHFGAKDKKNMVETVHTSLILSIIAVSYTHLYDANQNVCCLEIEITSKRIKSVSYTHLDVYKRQMPHQP